VRAVDRPSGSSARSQSGQSRLVPTRDARPSGVVTHGRSWKGGRCRTCWRCRQERSATQSPWSSWWKPSIARSTSRSRTRRVSTATGESVGGAGDVGHQPDGRAGVNDGW
jgi:hypothetical protein